MEGKGGDRYAPLDEINRDDVKDLRIVWRCPVVDPTFTEEFPDVSPSHYYKATPIMVGGVLYTPHAVGLIEAINPANGNTIWVQQPFRPTLKEASGQSMRGIDSWQKGSPTAPSAGAWQLFIGGKRKRREPLS
jgi:glucose dehydrogenase